MHASIWARKQNDIKRRQYLNSMEPNSAVGWRKNSRELKVAQINLLVNFWNSILMKIVSAWGLT